MTVDMERYEELLQQFGRISEDHIDEKGLQELKKKYKDEIDSKRLMEDIVDVNSLLKVLQKLGILEHDNISVLIDITHKYINDNPSIKQLITDYNQWLLENPDSIHFLYSGKSNVLSINHDPNKTLLKVSEIIDVHNSTENLPSSTEEITKEILLPNESLSNLSLSINLKNIHRNRLVFFNFKKYPRRIHKKKYITVLILFIFIFIFTGIIWILIKLSYKSVAVVPFSPSVQAASEQPQLNMSRMVNMNASSSRQSTYTETHTQIYTSAVSPIDREKDLQNLVINKISKRIGTFWKDVCRSLQIRENDIDEITIQYSKEPQKYEKMFRKGMELYFSEPRLNWKIELMQALKSANRVDIQESVQNILFEEYK